MSYFHRWDELETDMITPKYSPAEGQVLEGEKVLMAHIYLPAGPPAKRHAHPNEQISYVVKGRARVCIGNEEKIVGPGDVYIIPANTEHGGERGEIFEDLEVIVCKSVVPGFSLKNGQWEK